MDLCNFLKIVQNSSSLEMPYLPTKKLCGSLRRISIFLFIFVILSIQGFTWIKSGSVLFLNFPRYTPKFDKNLTLDTDVRMVNRPSILIELASAMNYSWKAYTTYAWGMDEVNVISNVGTHWMDASLTMIDSLDTLWMFNMTEEFNRCRDWITTHVNFDVDRDNSNVFESTIRLLGGLLSAFHLSGEKVFLEKAKLIGGKLIVAFNSPSGLPYTNINFGTLRASLPGNGRIVTLSEVATLQLEFNELAVLLQNASIARPAANVYRILDKVKKLSGLISTDIDMYHPENPILSTITLGARGDSYYEYLLKVWIQTGKKSEWLQNEYITAVNGMRDNLIRKSVPNGLTFVGELHGSQFSTKMDHLVCFLPATLAYGYLHGMPADHLELAISLGETCFQMYNNTKSGLSPELVYFNLANSNKSDFYIRRLDSFNLLRPEAIEAFFYLYQITKNPKYQEWGRQIFRSFNTYSRVEPAGYAPLLDVQLKVPGYKDKMESFWIAETLKYFLLLFDDSLASKYDLRKWVFNSEAHPFPLHSLDTISTIRDFYNF
nr:endoplasmic reticulum mannosyl oligosaccharide [Hymenolepis microstoma]